MAKAGARAQRVAERRQQILDAARAMAEADGWAAVTSRRLADAIGYTQPVLYGHFPGGKTEIMRTVALAGFAELAAATQAAMGAQDRSRRRSQRWRTCTWASPRRIRHSTRPCSSCRSMRASRKTTRETELRSGFNALSAALGNDDDGTATELFWSALHGMSLLERAGRMRQEHRPNRIAELAARFGH